MNQDKSVPMAAGGIVVGAIAFMVVVSFVFKGSMHF